MIVSGWFRGSKWRQGTDLQTLLKLLLLLVDDAEAEVDLVRLFKARLHAHDLGEGLFGVFQRAIPIVENANSVPQLGLFGIW